MIRYLTFLAAMAAITISSAAHAADWGTLKGRFVYDGTPPKPKAIDTGKEPACSKHKVVVEDLVVNPDNHGLANVVVFVSSKKVKENPEYKKTANDTVTIDNNGCRFEPHIVPMRLTQSLVIKNSDPFSHNSNLAPLGDRSENPVLTTDSEYPYGKFNRAQKLPVPVQCNIHPWMKGYIVVKDNPYIAVSDKDGNFEIKDLPADKLEFTVWQEKSGYLPAKSDWSKKGAFEIKIKPGDNNDLGEIKVSPKLFEKK